MGKGRGRGVNCVTSVASDAGALARAGQSHAGTGAASLALGPCGADAGVGNQIVFDAMLESALSTPWLLTEITPKNQVPELRLSIT